MITDSQMPTLVQELPRSFGKQAESKTSMHREVLPVKVVGAEELRQLRITRVRSLHEIRVWLADSWMCAKVFQHSPNISCETQIAYSYHPTV